MRSDMFKVIVERPRAGGYGKPSNGRKKEKSKKDYDNYPLHESTARKHRPYSAYKELNENLAPLQRFLHSRVGKHWDKVFSEICERIDMRSAVKKHIRDHVKSMVWTEVEQHRDGSIWTKGAYPWRIDYVEHYYRQHHHLYVHPTTGILTKARFRKK